MIAIYLHHVIVGISVRAACYLWLDVGGCREHIHIRRRAYTARVLILGVLKITVKTRSEYLLPGTVEVRIIDIVVALTYTYF